MGNLDKSLTTKDRPLLKIGFDSLAIADFKGIVDEAFKVNIPLLYYLEKATLSSLASLLVEEGGEPAAPPTPKTPTEWMDPAETAAMQLERLASLSDEEVDRQLRALPPAEGPTP